MPEYRLTEQDIVTALEKEVDKGRVSAIKLLMELRGMTPEKAKDIEPKGVADELAARRNT